MPYKSFWYYIFNQNTKNALSRIYIYKVLLYSDRHSSKQKMKSEGKFIRSTRQKLLGHWNQRGRLLYESFVCIPLCEIQKFSVYASFAISYVNTKTHTVRRLSNFTSMIRIYIYIFIYTEREKWPAVLGPGISASSHFRRVLADWRGKFSRVLRFRSVQNALRVKIHIRIFAHIHW